ncbi:MAG: hypothetical protein FJ088_04090 [Deltaproteobacteria bacterium]|nr:hypothetical protein [Deltaproteobacteria bacterium]
MSGGKKRRFIPFIIPEGFFDGLALVILLGHFKIYPVISIFLVFAFHLATLVLLYFGFIYRWDYRDQNDRNWALIGLLMTLPLPFIGFLAYAVLFTVSVSRKKAGDELLKEFDEYISYESYVSPYAREIENEDTFVQDEIDIAPLKAIMKEGDVDMKRGAILALSKIPRKDAVEILKRALADHEKEIRYYASSGLAEIEREYNDRIFRTLRDVERDQASKEKTLALLNLILDYIETGILDETMEEYFLKLAGNATEKHETVAGDYPDLKFLKARIRKRKGNFEAALKEFKECLSANPENIAVYHNMVEVYYELGMVNELRHTVEMIRERFPDQKDLLETERFLQ